MVLLAAVVAAALSLAELFFVPALPPFCRGREVHSPLTQPPLEDTTNNKGYFTIKDTYA